MEAYLPLIIQLVAGLIGGTSLGTALKGLSLGPIGNALAGLVGGGVLGQILQAVLTGSAGVDSGGVDLASVATNLIGGGAGGALLTALAGLVKNKLT